MEPVDLASVKNLHELARLRGRLDTDRIAFTFLVDGETEERHLTFGELDREAQILAGKLQTLGKTGDLYRERYWQQSQFEAVEQLRQHFQPRGRSLVQVAVAWVLDQPGITSAIVGASRPDQLDDSLAAADLTLDAQEQEACNLAWYITPIAAANTLATNTRIC